MCSAMRKSTMTHSKSTRPQTSVPIQTIGVATMTPTPSVLRRSLAGTNGVTSAKRVGRSLGGLRPSGRVGGGDDSRGEGRAETLLPTMREELDESGRRLIG